MKEELYLVIDGGCEITETRDFSHFDGDNVRVFLDEDEAKENLIEQESNTAYLFTVTVKKVQKVGGLTDVELD